MADETVSEAVMLSCYGLGLEADKAAALYRPSVDRYWLEPMRDGYKAGFYDGYAACLRGLQEHERQKRPAPADVAAGVEVGDG
jgi:hypothetical protein